MVNNGCAINNDKKFLAKYFDVLELKHAHILYHFRAKNKLFLIMMIKICKLNAGPLGTDRMIDDKVAVLLH